MGASSPLSAPHGAVQYEERERLGAPLAFPVALTKSLTLLVLYRWSHPKMLVAFSDGTVAISHPAMLAGLLCWSPLATKFEYGI